MIFQSSHRAWATVFTGTYRVKAGAPSPRLRLSAAGLSIGREVPACLHSAAELHGFGVLDDEVTHVVVRPDEPCLRRVELWPHQLALAADDLVRLRCGALATNAHRTAVDLARPCPASTFFPCWMPRSPQGFARRNRWSRSWSGMQGSAASDRPGNWCRWRTRSGVAAGVPMRLRCHDAGLPPPTPQFPVLDPRGCPRRWLDLAWAEAKVGLEYDGEEGHSGWQNLRSDRRRHNFLQDDGWAMFYATDIDVYRDHEDLMRKVGAAVSRRTQRG